MRHTHARQLSPLVSGWGHAQTSHVVEHGSAGAGADAAYELYLLGTTGDRRRREAHKVRCRRRANVRFSQKSLQQKTSRGRGAGRDLGLAERDVLVRVHNARAAEACQCGPQKLRAHALQQPHRKTFLKRADCLRFLMSCVFSK